MRPAADRVRAIGSQRIKSNARAWISRNESRRAGLDFKKWTQTQPIGFQGMKPAVRNWIRKKATEPAPLDSKKGIQPGALWLFFLNPKNAEIWL
jgi:hypothetical protein